MSQIYLPERLLLDRGAATKHLRLWSSILQAASPFALLRRAWQREFPLAVRLGVETCLNWGLCALISDRFHPRLRFDVLGEQRVTRRRYLSGHLASRDVAGTLSPNRFLVPTRHNELKDQLESAGKAMLRSCFCKISSGLRQSATPGFPISGFSRSRRSSRGSAFQNF